MKKIFSKKHVFKKGFSLVEILVAMFIFVMIISASSGAFVSFMRAQKHAKALQTNLEDAQYTMASMSKTLRTSRFISLTGTTFPTEYPRLTVYDYSQAACVRYRFNRVNHRLEIQLLSAEESVLLNANPCSTTYFSNHGIDYWSDVVSDSFIEDMTFLAVASQGSPNPVVGRMTVSVEICSTDDCSGSGNKKTNLQFSVSLRDYATSGLVR